MSNVNASPATRKMYECMLLVEACVASAELTTAINALGQLDVILHRDAAALSAAQSSLAAALQVIEDVRALALELDRGRADLGPLRHPADLKNVYFYIVQRIRTITDKEPGR